MLGELRARAPAVPVESFPILRRNPFRVASFIKHIVSQGCQGANPGLKLANAFSIGGTERRSNAADVAPKLLMSLQAVTIRRLRR